MKRLILSSLMLIACGLYAQQGTLKAVNSKLSTDGGLVTISAHATYERADVLGWTVTLPAGWSCQATGGANRPEVAPASGAVNSLSWAYIAVPAGQADFDFTLYYPPGLRGAQAVKADLIVRVDGKTTTVPVAPVAFRVTPKVEGRQIQ